VKVGSKIRAHWSLFAAIAILWGALAGFLRICIVRDGGRFVYAIDDPYITMAVAKNFVGHGVWGVTPFMFSWCTSTPLWTWLIILAYAIFGVGSMTPLVLDFVCASATCLVVYLLLRRRGLDPAELLVALMLVIFATSLPALAFTGEEHILQALLTIVFIDFAAADLAAPTDSHRAALIALAPLVTTVRYEGMFLLAPVVGLFILRRRIITAAAIAIAGALPVIALGLWSISKGSGFFPNSIMLKANLPGSGSFAAVVRFLAHLCWNLASAPWLVLLAILAIGCIHLILKAGRPLWDRDLLAMAIFLAVAAAQASFALTGGVAFFRYDAYLVATGIFLLASCWREPWMREFVAGVAATPRRRTLRIAVVAIAAIALIPRAIAANALIPRASHNIYEQQYQMARFVDRFYQDQGVALNDIGAVCFLSDIRLLDVVGLATQRVADEREAGRFDNAMIAEITATSGTEIAIVYDEYLFGPHSSARPANWIKAGEWRIADAKVVQDTVSFYGIGEEQAQILRANLAAFTPALPASVDAVIIGGSANMAGAPTNAAGPETPAGGQGK